MDLAETVFNLRDIRSSMAIIIVADLACASLDLVGQIAAAVPGTTLVSADELKLMLRYSGPQIQG
jgi:hypothetical protein